jgi:hypothetical protein
LITLLAGDVGYVDAVNFEALSYRGGGVLVIANRPRIEIFTPLGYVVCHIELID